MSTSGIDLCACKRGVFTLRDCGNPATTTCSLCSRRVCDEHLAPRIDTKVCVECAARQEESGTAAPYGAAGEPGTQPGGPTAPVQQPALGPPLERLDPTDSAVRWRTRYYRNRGYEPIWWGTYDPYWDSWGYRWYDDDDDDDRGGFGDS